MTLLNAYKYLRGLPAKSDKGAASRLEAMLNALELAEMPRRVFHILCAGINARHMSAMLGSVLREAGIGAALLSFDAPYEPGSPEPVLINGEKPDGDALVRSVDTIRRYSRTLGGDDAVSRYEVLAAHGLAMARAADVRVIITDVSGLPREALRLLPTASLVVLGTLPSDPAQLLRTVIVRGTAETVSTQQTAEVQRLITDRCADAGCRLTVAAKRGLPGGPEVRSVSFAGFSVVYRGIELRTPSVFVSSLASACTSCDGAYALRRSGMDIGDDAIVRGICAAAPAFYGTVISIKPAVIAAALPNGLADAAADEMRSRAVFSALASDIASSGKLTGDAVRVFWLHGDALPHEFESALAKCGVEVLSVITARDGEKLAAAARRAAAEIIVTDEEIENRDDSAGVPGRSYIIIGTAAEMDVAVPQLKQGIRRTMF